MQKKEGMDVPVVTVILIAVTIILTGTLLYWSGIYTRNLTENTEEDKTNLLNAYDVNMKILNVQFDPYFTSDIIITLENTGKRVIERIMARVTMADGTIYSDTFPNKIEYPSESLDLKFFEVKQFKIFFGSQSLSHYAKIELIPLVKNEGDNLRPVEPAAKEWTPKN